MMTNKEIIEVVQAADRGEKIQFRYDESESWSDCGETIFWNFGRCYYRVKPTPRKFWINMYPKGNPGCAYYTKEEADNAASVDRIECVEVIEVIN